MSSVNTDMEWKKEQLVEFIIEASRNTYANPDAPKSISPYRPGCEEYLYESGDWKYLDSYAWNKDGGGEEIVYYKGQPVWLMNYYGFVTAPTDTKAMYAFLHEALRERHPVLPVRGASHSSGAFRYEIAFEKDEIENLLGVERIYENDALVYECYVHGGLVR